jgi:Tfp pilus assembly protein PilF
LHPTYAEAWGKLALTYDASGETEKARNAFQKAFHISPEIQDLSLNMGYFELKHGNQNDALQIFRMGLESNPQDNELMNAYKKLKKSLGDNQ